MFLFADVLAWGCGESEGVEDAEGPSPLSWVDAAHSLGALCACAAPPRVHRGHRARRVHRAATGGHDHAVRVWNIADDALLLHTTLEGKHPYIHTRFLHNVGIHQSKY